MSEGPDAGPSPQLTHPVPNRIAVIGRIRDHMIHRSRSKFLQQTCRRRGVSVLRCRHQQYQQAGGDLSKGSGVLSPSSNRVGLPPDPHFPDPVGTPAIESLPKRVGFPVTGGKIIPGNSGFQHVKHSFHKQPVIGCRASGIPLFVGSQVFDLLPLSIGQSVTAWHVELILEVPQSLVENQILR